MYIHIHTYININKEYHFDPAFKTAAICISKQLLTCIINCVLSNEVI